MVPFNSKKVRVEHLYLKACTTALGGSISVVDQKRSTDTREVYTRLPAPYAVVRAFIKSYKTSKYIKPVLVAVVFYGNRVVALERKLDREIKDSEWTSYSERNVESFLKEYTKEGKWYIDGTYVFRVGKEELDKATSISSDGFFRTVDVQAIKLPMLRAKILETRTCLQVVTKNGDRVLSPPVWKHFHSMGMLGIIEREENDGGEPTVEIGKRKKKKRLAYPFDYIDNKFAVNLSFALKAGKQIGSLFGYQAIEPLQLDEMMIRLRTVNLPNVSKELKYTMSINMQFTHVVAWLMGMLSRTNTVDNYAIVCSLLKYVTTKGVFVKAKFDAKAIFRNPDDQNVPLYDASQHGNPDSIDIEDLDGLDGDTSDDDDFDLLVDEI